MELPLDQFLAQVMAAIKALGGLPWALKIASIVLLIIASMKVAVVRNLIWDRLGAAKAFVAPVLGLIVGLLSMAAEGNVTVAGVFAYLFAGAGALAIHELLDAVKGIPGIGQKYIQVCEFISKIFGGKKEITETK